MKIQKMTAHFGALDGRTLVLSDGLNILYAPNESGKSTWCAFLRAMLFGVSTSQRAKAGQKPDKIKYRPWDGAPMSGSMEVVTEDGPVTIRRWTERENQPMQAFSATVTGTETPVPGITSATAGPILTGVTAEVFERSAFIRQAGLEVSADPELDRRISAIVSSGDEEISCMETEKRLRTWQRHRRSGGRGAIPALESELDETRRTLSGLRAQADTMNAAAEEIESLEARQAELDQKIRQTRASLRKNALASMGEARRQVQAAEETRRAADEALERAKDALDATPYGLMGPEEASRRSEKDRNTAAELRHLAEKLPPVKWAYIPLALAVAAFVLALVLPWKTECAAVGCIFALLFVVMFTRLQSLQKTKADTLADRRRILDAYGVDEADEIDGLLENYRVLWKEKERAEFRCETAEAALAEKRAAQKRIEARAVNDLDFVNGDNAAADLARERDRIRSRIEQCRETRALAEGQARALGDPMALESELADGERRHGELLRQEEALTLALDTLGRADAELQRRISPRLAQKAAEYFSFLTDGRYDEVTLTRDLAAKARRAGDAVGWELDYLSAGAKDQLYLALRLAVCDLALPGDDPCPIVLDDALVTFDSERMARALELMRSIAEKRQVLLFTCHEREGAYFADDPAVTKQTILE